MPTKQLQAKVKAINRAHKDASELYDQPSR